MSRLAVGQALLRLARWSMLRPRRDAGMVFGPFVVFDWKAKV